ncbi:MAG: hypothetical protein ArsCj_3670 [Arsenophonus endosymbiont of Ceratovacuna japonica]
MAKNNKHLLFRNKCFLFRLFIIIIIILILLIIVYDIYLYKKISDRLNGKIWDLPSAIYSRIINFEPSMNYNKEEIIRLLNNI